MHSVLCLSPHLFPHLSPHLNLKPLQILRDMVSQLKNIFLTYQNHGKTTTSCRSFLSSSSHKL